MYIRAIADMIIARLKTHPAINVGAGAEKPFGCTPKQLDSAVKMLMEEGYRVDTFHAQQLGSSNTTLYKVLSRPDITREAARNIYLQGELHVHD